MKVINYVFLCSLLVITHLCIACPTCIGRIDKNMPPFFSAEFDEHYNAHYSEAEVPVDGASDTNTSDGEEA